MQEVKLLAASVTKQGHKAVTYQVRYPAIIHAEVLRHRMFGQNYSSFRAIPASRMREDVACAGFGPYAWQKAHKGMQGYEYFVEKADIDTIDEIWGEAACKMQDSHKELTDLGVTKQLANRLLQPFTYMTGLITTTEIENFFYLRCPKLYMDGQVFRSRKSLVKYLDKTGCQDEMRTEEYMRSINKSTAEIHIQALAEEMYDLYQEAEFKLLEPGEYHLPYPGTIEGNTVKAARVSYSNHLKPLELAVAKEKYNSLLAQKHASAFEHCLKAMSDEEYDAFTHTYIHPETDEFIVERGWCRNYRGFISHRFEVGL